MQGLKKTLTVAALVVLIGAAIVWGVFSALGKGNVPEPDWRLNQPQERIDVNTLEIYTKSEAEWRKLESDGAWKNPDTGDYTLRRVKRCVSCGEKVPAMRMSAGKKRPEQVLAELGAAMEYKCPKCGGQVYPAQALPQPGRVSR